MKQYTTVLQKIVLSTFVAAMALSGCSENNYIRKSSPNKGLKDYTYENKDNASILGVGEPISNRQMRADATFSLKGMYALEAVMKQIATTYNVAIRWGDGTRKVDRKDVLINNLSFDELRAYVEDVYDVQIIREGERRLLILPSTSEARLASFSPGDGVALGTALRGLAEQCGYNLVINDNIGQLSSPISTNLKDVTCIDAFEALLTPVGMSIIKKGDYFTLSGLPQRQWTVNLYEPVRNERVEVNYSSDMTGSGGGSTSTAGGKNTVTVTYDRDLWTDLEADLNQMITTQCALAKQAQQSGGTVTTAATQSSTTAAPTLLPPAVGDEAAADPTVMNPTAVPATTTATPAATATEDDEDICGYVKINKSVGLIQMRAAQSLLEEADDIISRVEEVATRRLMLEARVLAVTKNRNYDQNGRLITERGDQLFGYNDSKTSIASTLASFLDGSGGSGNAGANGTGAGGFFSIGNATLQAAVQFLEAYGTTYELMHPRIELMDRQRATLIDGRNEKYYLVKRTTTPQSGQPDIVDITTEEKSQFLGLQFSVAAQVGEPGEPHTISLQLPITSLAKTITVPDGSGSQVPVATTRLIDQQVRLRDGEIKVIGGLTKTIAVDRESGIPIFREVPVAGKLGNDENISYENVEFVVLLQVRRAE